MVLVGAHKKDSTDLRDRGIAEVDLLRLPLTSVTRNAGGLITQTINTGTAPDGKTHTVTKNFTRNGTTGLVDVETRIYVSNGRTITETETFTRNGSGLIVSSAIVVS